MTNFRHCFDISGSAAASLYVAQEKWLALTEPQRLAAKKALAEAAIMGVHPHDFQVLCVQPVASALHQMLVAIEDL